VTNPDSPDTDQPTLGVGITPTRTPDGQWWVLIQYSTGILTTTVLLPPEGADQMATDLPERLHNAAKECRQKQSGLVVPEVGNVDLGQLRKKFNNG
jgi:hypothetical protein